MNSTELVVGQVYKLWKPDDSKRHLIPDALGVVYNTMSLGGKWNRTRVDTLGKDEAFMVLEKRGVWNLKVLTPRRVGWLLVEPNTQFEEVTE